MSQGIPERTFQEVSQLALSLIRDEVHGLFSRCSENTSEVNATLKMLFWYLASRSQAVSFLASNGFGWDAEIVLRSFYETAAKILFICFADEAEKDNLVVEFWRGLGSIDDRRTARKANFAKNVFDAGDISNMTFALLEDGRLFDLNPEGSRAERKRLEQKWSFSEILESLSKRNIGGESLSNIRALLHIYGMASHLIHADQAAMGLMSDRASRDSSERALLEESHICRIFSDQVNISWFCADALRRHFSETFSDLERLREAVNLVMQRRAPFFFNA